MTLTHLSLFSGIGGLDLAAAWAGFRTVGQVECADYPFRVLRRQFGRMPRWRDIRDVTGKEIIRRCGCVPTIISGGFPCQPHSFSGKRLASGDARDLWGEFYRIICETRPRWVVGENVAGIRSSEAGRFFGRVLRDLAEMGYNVGWGSWEAADAGAPHHRERVFIVAHANDAEAARQRRDGGEALSFAETAGSRSRGPHVADPTRELQHWSGIAGTQRRPESPDGSGDVPDPDGHGCSGSRLHVRSGRQGKTPSVTGRGVSVVPDPDGERCEERNPAARSGVPGLAPWSADPVGRLWESEPDVGRVAHGVPSRVDRLRALGNAVVPQQAYPIFAAIAEIETEAGS